MFIKEGEKAPFGYGLVRYCRERYHTCEYLPIPICWIKRFYYWTLYKTRVFDWEKEMAKKQTENWNEIIKVLDNLNEIYIRGEVDKKWESLSLMELIKAGETTQVINWIKDFLKNPKN